MSDRRRVNQGRWLSNIKKGYYHVCQSLGLSTKLQTDPDIADAIFYAVYQTDKSIQEIYAYLGNKNRCLSSVIKQKMETVIKSAAEDIVKHHGESELSNIQERYFGHPEADITSPEAFIYGLAGYLKKSR